MESIRRHEGVDPDDGVRNYGNVEFADPVNNRFPLDTPAHIRESFRLFDMEARSNDSYSSAEAEGIRERILEAARAHDVEIEATAGGGSAEPDA